MEQTAAVASSVHYLSNVITLCSLVDRGSQYTKAPDKAIPSPNHLGDVDGSAFRSSSCFTTQRLW